MIQQRKHLILTQFFFGINRIYLLTNKKLLKFISYFYTFILAAVVTYISLSERAKSSRHAITKYPPFTEEILLIIITFGFGRQKLEKFYLTLRKFDEILKIVGLITEKLCVNIVLSVCVILPLAEVLSIFMIFYHFTYDNELFSTVCWVITHDFEQIFHILNLRLVYLRARVLKAHVVKMFSENGCWCGNSSFDQVEKLCGKVELDIRELYKAYYTLYKSSVLLNSAMGFPLLIAFANAATQIVISSNLAFTYINTSLMSSIHSNYLVLYMSLRAAKFAVFVLLPSYYSRTTAAQISEIRNVIFDVIDCKRLDKTSRDKLKYFLMMTKECTFSYKLKGIVKLDTSLPIQFINVCITYIFISINFNKFIHAN